MCTANPLWAQGSLMLAGGGTEGANGDASSWSYQPYRWLADFASDDTLVVLSQSGHTSIDSYFSSLGAKTVLLRTTDQDLQTTAQFIATAQAVFLRGGNQEIYLNVWKDTAVEDALTELFTRGGAIGGTSAGAMVLSEFISYGGPFSSENLANPFNEHNEITDGFLSFLENIIVDTHHFQRARSGRLLGYLGYIQKKFNRSVAGWGIDAHTAITVDAHGQAEVHGAGAVQLCYPSASTEIQATLGAPLRIASLPCAQLTDGFQFNITDGSITVSPASTRLVSAQQLDPLWIYHLRFASDITADSYVTDRHETDGSQALWVVISNTQPQLPAAFSSHSNTIFWNISSGDELQSTPEMVSAIQEAERIFLAIDELNVLRTLLSESNDNDNPNPVRLASKKGTILELPLTFFDESGSGYASNLNSGRYIAEDGLLKTQTGLNLLPETVVVLDALRAEDKNPQDDYFPDRRDNHASAVGWLMREYEANAAIIGNGVQEVRIDDTNITIRTAQNSRNVQVPTIYWKAAKQYHTAANQFNISPETDKPRISAAVSSYQLYVVPSDQSFDWTTTTTSVTEPPTDTERPRSVQIKKLYPNPFNPVANLWVHLAEPSTLQIDIHTITGQRVLHRYESQLSMGTHLFQLNFTGLATGSYFIGVETDTDRDQKQAIYIK
ncbi:MAG: Type 1 glutamine amidotransferase-like domain-containing protein [Bacteroidota bacterium]